MAVLHCQSRQELNRALSRCNRPIFCWKVRIGVRLVVSAQMFIVSVGFGRRLGSWLSPGRSSTSYGVLITSLCLLCSTFIGRKSAQAPTVRSVSKKLIPPSMPFGSAPWLGIHGLWSVAVSKKFRIRWRSSRSLCSGSSRTSARMI